MEDGDLAEVGGAHFDAIQLVDPKVLGNLTEKEEKTQRSDGKSISEDIRTSIILCQNDEEAKSEVGTRAKITKIGGGNTKYPKGMKSIWPTLRVKFDPIKEGTGLRCPGELQSP